MEDRVESVADAVAPALDCEVEEPVPWAGSPDPPHEASRNAASIVTLSVWKKRLGFE